MNEPRFHVLLITDDAQLAQAFIAEYGRQAPGAPVDCDHDHGQALSRLCRSWQRRADRVRYLVVVDLGRAQDGDCAGARFMDALATERLISSTPVIVLVGDAEAVRRRWPAATLLASIDNARLPAAVARVRMLGQHLWPPTTPPRPELTLLIVEDDPVDMENLRRLIAKANAGRWRILSATTGKEAIAIGRQEHPDLVFLDYRLPDRSGAEILRTLRLRWVQRMPLVISLTGAGSEQVAREMFLLGVADYLRKELLSASVLARYLNEARRRANAAPPLVLDDRPLPEPPELCIVVCGSAGATAPLFLLLDRLEPGPSAALLIALHLPANGDSQLSTMLQLHAGAPLSIAAAGQHPEAGKVHLCPVGFDIALDGGRYQLIDAHRLAGVPSLDVLLESLAHGYRGRVVAVILSGLGRDGTRGAVAVAEAGGRVLALDPSTTDFPSMIDAVLATGCVAATGGPVQLAGLLNRQVAAATGR